VEPLPHDDARYLMEADGPFVVFFPTVDFQQSGIEMTITIKFSPEN